MSIHPAVKYSEHVATTSKLIYDQKPVTSGRVRRKVVRVILTDGDATDSSSDDEGVVVRRVKRHVQEINFETSTVVLPKKQGPLAKKKRTLNLPESDTKRRKKFRGVRQRPWGRWAAEIRDPTLRKRLWLGTYDTPEEAASKYDEAAVKLKGPNAVTNFPNVSAKTETVVDGGTEKCGIHNEAASSPTSVLRYEELTAFDGLGYGDVDAFGFDIDVPLSLPDKVLSTKYSSEEEFGEFDPDDFLVDVIS
ncbi:hypothetical protein L1049_012800 [Liquidambar formosana]|uniref:AP2/ERF domain-containing protein n=1 Tax=Liquidambar formosana TaxID=63359 RepID=A0AAP0RLX0_LIQFO